MSKTIRIVVVDDEINVVRALERLIRREMKTEGGREDLQVETWTSPGEALAYLAHHRADLVLSDYRMPGMDGVSLLTQVRALQPHAARLILSAQADFQALVDAINRAAIYRFIAKPWDDDELIAILRTALAEQGERLEDQTLADELRLARQEVSPEDVERRRLEVEEPGITHVEWENDGSIRLDKL